MESQPQNPEFRIDPENFHPCLIIGVIIVSILNQGLKFFQIPLVLYRTRAIHFFTHPYTILLVPHQTVREYF